MKNDMRFIFNESGLISKGFPLTNSIEGDLTS